MQIFTVCKENGSFRIIPGATFRLQYQEPEHQFNLRPNVGIEGGLKVSLPLLTSPHALITPREEVAISRASVIFRRQLDRTRSEPILVREMRGGGSDDKSRALVWFPGGVKLYGIPSPHTVLPGLLMPGLVAISPDTPVRAVLFDYQKQLSGELLQRECDSYDVAFDGAELIVDGKRLSKTEGVWV